MNGDPWGNSAHTALVWAYAQMGRTASTINVLGEMRSPTRNRADMTALDGRAQAALIRREVERLTDRTCACHLIACLLPRPTKERLAGGKTGLVDRHAIYRRWAVDEVAGWIMGKVPVTASFSACRQVELDFALGRSGTKKLAKTMNVRYSTARSFKEHAYAALVALYDDGEAAVGQRLVALGLIDPEPIGDAA